MVDKLEGADSAALAQKLQRLIVGSSGSAPGGRLATAPSATVQQPLEVSPNSLSLASHLTWPTSSVCST